jgi:hypothetical protein
MVPSYLERFLWFFLPPHGEINSYVFRLVVAFIMLLCLSWPLDFRLVYMNFDIIVSKVGLMVMNMCFLLRGHKFKSRGGCGMYTYVDFSSQIVA